MKSTHDYDNTLEWLRTLDSPSLEELPEMAAVNAEMEKAAIAQAAERETL